MRGLPPILSMHGIFFFFSFLVLFSLFLVERSLVREGRGKKGKRGKGLVDGWVI